MIFAVKTSLGILFLLVLVETSSNLNELCQALKCNPSKEICRFNKKCNDSNAADLSRCVSCLPKESSNSRAKTLLASSISQQQLPLAPRLLAKSDGQRLLADNLSPTISTNETLDDSTYDDYYTYDDEETSDKNDLGEEDDYLDDYAEPIDKVIQGTQPIRKVGTCPKVIPSIGECDPSTLLQSNCRFDTDCSGEDKCCEAACGKRVCTKASKVSVSVCPTSFTCTLNCRLGYQTDANGCLLCQCQSCPSMDQCQKNCPSGYLKDLFGCDICECQDQCPPLICDLRCSSDVGYAKNKDGCPICQCAASKAVGAVTERTSLCQDDVHCPPGFRCLNDAHNVPMCQAAVDSDQAPSDIPACPEGFADSCKLQCPDANFALDTNGCPICACAPSNPSPVFECPMVKCRANCGNAGYKRDENGCQTCQCAAEVAVKPRAECSGIMCRMFCVNGFQRDENGCEICRCNTAPQPCPAVACDNPCPNGYRKDYSGCPTCSCEERKPEIVTDGCTPLTCGLNCKYGYERDLSGCQLCSCNVCPLQSCRMFCMYGFKKNSDGCDVCECNWLPVAEKISCSERIPCTGNRICNLNLRLCEIVSADKVNWFVYNFNIQSELFNDRDFVDAFKKGLINNIAAKYDFEPGQITVSAVELDSTTSFQIMPYFSENLDEFQRKIDQVDGDLNSHEFRNVVPAVANIVMKTDSGSKWNRYIRSHPRFALYLTAVSFGIVALILAGILTLVCRKRSRYPYRSDSKEPIFEGAYHQAPTEDEHYHAVHAPDGTAYVVVESDEMPASNEKRAIV